MRSSTVAHRPCTAGCHAATHRGSCAHRFRAAGSSVGAGRRAAVAMADLEGVARELDQRAVQVELASGQLVRAAAQAIWTSIAADAFRARVDHRRRECAHLARCCATRRATCAASARPPALRRSDSGGWSSRPNMPPRGWRAVWCRWSGCSETGVAVVMADGHVVVDYEELARMSSVWSEAATTMAGLGFRVAALATSPELFADAIFDPGGALRSERAIVGAAVGPGGLAAPRCEPRRRRSIAESRGGKGKTRRRSADAPAARRRALAADDAGHADGRSSRQLFIVASPALRRWARRCRDMQRRSPKPCSQRWLRRGYSALTWCGTDPLPMIRSWGCRCGPPSPWAAWVPVW